MICFPNAKINLGLTITEKRNDGFHNLQSCFYPIPWSDILEIIPQKQLSFQSTGLPIPGASEDNLCLKAFHLLAKDFDIDPVSIHLHKIIPIGAGLGGGSSDAAFTLVALNEIFNLLLDNDTLCDYARLLGSDCAFFIDNSPVYATEKGDQFESMNHFLQGNFLIVIYPDIHVSTGEAYNGIKPKKPLQNCAQIIKTTPLEQWKNKLLNDFEAHIFDIYPELPKIKEMLYTSGAQYVSMTGSGSAIYGIFNGEPKISPHLESFKCWKGFL